MFENVRIALTTPYDLNIPGGVNTQLWGLYRYLTRVTGARVRIMGPASHPEEIDCPDALPIGRICRLPMNGAISNLTFDPAIRTGIRAFMRSFNPDIAHYQEPFAPALNNVALRYSKAFNVASFHTYRERLSLGYLMAWPYLRYMLNRIHARIAVSDAARRFVARLYPGYYHIIPNAVDTSSIPVVPDIDTEERKKNLLFVGRADEPRKGFIHLMNAFERLRKLYPGQYRLDVAGGSDAGYRPSYSLDDSQWHGPVSPEKLSALYAACDVVCAPSVRGESFGVVLLEAFSYGKPVVGFLNTGYREFVGSRKAAALVPVCDEQALADAIHNVCSDRRLYHAMSAEARSLADEYSWNRIGPRIVEVYQQGLCSDKTG